MIKKEKIKAVEVGVAEVITSEVKDVKPTKVTKYSKAPFYPSQEVRIIKKLELKDFIHDGESVDVKKGMSDLLDKINDQLDELPNAKVVSSSGDECTINYGKELFFTDTTDPYDELFPDKKFFLIIPDKYLGGIISEEDGDKQEVSAFSSFMINASPDSFERISSTIKRIKTDVSYKEKEIKNYAKQINEYRKSINAGKINLKLEFEKANSLFELEDVAKDYSSYYRSILKNKDIKSVNVVEHNGSQCLLVETNELTYHDTVDHNFMSRRIKDLEFNIGAFVILIKKDGTLLISNKTKFVGSGQHQTCVDSNSHVCTGASYGDAFRKAVLAGDYASAIHMTISFLKDPNSTNPHLDSVNFYFAQDRKWKPEKLTDYISHSSNYNESWDRALYDEKLKKFLAEHK